MMNTNDQPSVSIVVTCRPHEEGIRRCIASLAEQDYPDDRVELIIVNTDDPDRFNELKNELTRETSELDIRCLRQSKRLSPTVACDIGVAHANGEIVAFTGENMTAEPQWLSRGLDHFQRSNVGAVEGAIVHSMPVESSCFSVEQTSTRGGCYSPMNLFVRRELFEALGGFDPRCISGESGSRSPAGRDFACRVISAGWRIPCASEAVCRQQEAVPSWKHSIRRARRRRSEVLIARRHPHVVRDLRSPEAHPHVEGLARWGNLIALPAIATSAVLGNLFFIAAFVTLYFLTLATMLWARVGISPAAIIPVLPIAPAEPWMHAFHLLRGWARCCIERIRPSGPMHNTGVVRVEEIGTAPETFSRGRVTTVSVCGHQPEQETVRQTPTAEDGLGNMST